MGQVNRGITGRLLHQKLKAGVSLKNKDVKISHKLKTYLNSRLDLTLLILLLLLLCQWAI